MVIEALKDYPSQQPSFQRGAQFLKPRSSYHKRIQSGENDVNDAHLPRKKEGMTKEMTRVAKIRFCR